MTLGVLRDVYTDLSHVRVQSQVRRKGRSPSRSRSGNNLQTLQQDGLRRPQLRVAGIQPLEAPISPTPNTVGWCCCGLLRCVNPLQRTGLARRPTQLSRAVIPVKVPSPGVLGIKPRAVGPRSHGRAAADCRIGARSRPRWPGTAASSRRPAFCVHAVWRR